MGSRITKRLLAKGHAVTGYDLFAAKQPELVAMGGTWASSPRAVCEAADTTFVMVTNTAALEGASQGPDGLLAGLGAGKLLIDMSTVGPATSRALAAKVRNRAPTCSTRRSRAASRWWNRASCRSWSADIARRSTAPSRCSRDRPESHLHRRERPRIIHEARDQHQYRRPDARVGRERRSAEKAGVARETAIEVLTNSAIASPLVQYKGRAS